MSTRLESLSISLGALLLSACLQVSEGETADAEGLPRGVEGAADGFLGSGDSGGEGSITSTPPQGFADLAEAVPGLRFDIRYHGTDNFTQAPLPGYGAPAAWLVAPAAQALADVLADLEAQGLGLLVLDGYRPRRASEAMVAWAHRVGRPELVGPYVASRSRHNHGVAVDLTLVDLATGTELDMGTPFDTFGEASHTYSASGAALDNRQLLRSAMSARGFRPYDLEWWHFSYPFGDSGPRDVPYGCFEPAEGTWTAPEGWDEPGYEVPTTWDPSPCVDAFIGTSCASDQDCSRLGGGFCLRAGGGSGFCSMACDNRCPDREAFPMTFCIWSGEIAGVGHVPSGVCVPREEAAFGGCDAIGGTEPRNLCRFNDPETVATVCLPWQP